MEYTEEKRECQNCKKDFTIEPEDFNFYEKISVPPPTFCPECRLIRRFLWRNENSFNKNICSLCKENIITIYSDKVHPVYCHNCWWGDGWDGMLFKKEYNFETPFLNQFKDLISNVPYLNMWSFSNINCNYSNYTGYSKNSYLSSAAYCEDVFYCKVIEKSKNCFDSNMIVNSELCYENFDVDKCFNSIFLNNCRDCINSSFLYDCVNCQHCFMSNNLRNKNYYIRNKKYNREDYIKEIKKINFGNVKINEFLKKEFFELIQNSIHKYASITKSINSTGDYIKNSKNINNSFIVDGENLKNCWRVTAGSIDCYDVSGCVKNELLYEASVVAVGSYFSKFFSHSKIMNNCQLMYLCADCSNCFGCVGLRNKSYCILNKQYTKEEYEEMVPKIIKHMNDMPYIDSKGIVYKYGEFFPPELSPFCYNETIAQEYYPLTKEEAIRKGYRWKDKEERNYNIDIYNKDIPDDINEVDESIINKVIECTNSTSLRQGNKVNEQTGCTEAFKIIEPEFQFYKRMNLPLPRLCPNCRHYNRLKQRNPLKLWHRKCMKENCTNEFETSYAPDRPEIIYCEECYKKEIY